MAIRELDVYDRGYKNGMQAAIERVADLAREAGLAGDAQGAEALDYAAGELLQLRKDFLAEYS